MRLLGIDYGSKRIGLAYGDELGVATPLPALVMAEPAVRFTQLVELARRRRVTALVVGYPYNMDDTIGPKAREVDAFIAQLEQALGLPVHRVDERLTSYEAESSLSKTQQRELRTTGIVDSRAAALILQDYLDQTLPPVPPASPDGSPHEI